MNLNLSLTEDQYKFFQLPHKYKAFVGGYGSGKTETLLSAAIMDSLISSKAVIGLYSPTYDLLKLTIAPRLCAKLNELGVRYKYNKSDHTISTSNKGIGDFIMRSLDNPERIIAYEVFRSHIDELDTLKKDHAAHCFNMIMGRNRQNIEGGLENKIGVYTTPEGFNFCYDKFYNNPEKDYGIHQASTLSNPFLPKGYIEGLRKDFPAQLVEAYVNGQFVNLTQGSVYNNFDSILNLCNSEIEESDLELHIGLDFNIGHMAAGVIVKRGNEHHLVDEIIDAFDTAEIINIISTRYAQPGRIIKIYPDASGQSRKTSSGPITDHQMLRNAGFKVYVDGVNPPVQDRVNIVNAAFCNAAGQRRFKINDKKCKKIKQGIIQQTYRNGVPDKTSGIDHGNDAVGYAIVKLIPYSAGNITKLIRFN